MATLSECTRRWRKKRLLVLLSNNYEPSFTIWKHKGHTRVLYWITYTTVSSASEVEPSVSLAKTAAFRHRQLQTRFSRNDVSSK
eukprot:scaffold174207_cov77-Attheya_sp.AAC.1